MGNSNRKNERYKYQKYANTKNKIDKISNVRRKISHQNNRMGNKLYRDIYIVGGQRSIEMYEEKTQERSYPQTNKQWEEHNKYLQTENHSEIMETINNVHINIRTIETL